MKMIKITSIMILILTAVFAAGNTLYAQGISISDLVLYADFESDTPGSPPDTSLVSSAPAEDNLVLGLAAEDGNSALVVADGDNNWLEIVQANDSFPRKVYFYGKLNDSKTAVPVEAGQYTLYWTSSLVAAGSEATGAGFGNIKGGFAFAVIYGADGTIIVRHYGGDYDTGIAYNVGIPQTFRAEMDATNMATFTLYINDAPVADAEGNLLIFTFKDFSRPLAKFAVTIGHNATYRIDNIMLVQHPLVEPYAVEIDIKPGGGTSCIKLNLSANGVVPVAIYSTNEFDAVTINPETVALGSALVKSNKKGKFMCHEDDVDGDGLVDMLCQVYTEDLKVTAGGELWAVLDAETFGGMKIRGEENICVVKE